MALSLSLYAHTYRNSVSACKVDRLLISFVLRPFRLSRSSVVLPCVQGLGVPVQPAAAAAVRSHTKENGGSSSLSLQLVTSIPGFLTISLLSWSYSPAGNIL